MSATLVPLTLYDFENELVSLGAALDDAAALTPEQSAELAVYVENFLAKSKEKRDSFVRFLDHLDVQEGMAKEEERRLAARRKRIAAAREQLQAYAVGVMQRLDLKKLEGNTSEMRLQTNPPQVEITYLEMLPDRFQSVVVTVPAEIWAEHIKRHNEMRELFTTDDALPGPSRLEQVATVERIPHKAEIAAAIKRGENVPGADLIIGKQRLVRS